MNFSYWVEIKGMSGDVEWDSTFARAVRGDEEGTLDLDCVVEADSGAAAIVEARRRHGESGVVESVVRVQEQVLPRLRHRGRDGDTTLGRMRRQGVRIEFADATSAGNLEYSATFQGWTWADAFVMESVHVLVWEKERRAEVLAERWPFFSEGGLCTAEEFERVVLGTRVELELAVNRSPVAAEWTPEKLTSPGHVSALLSRSLRSWREGREEDAWRAVGFAQGMVAAMNPDAWAAFEFEEDGRTPKWRCGHLPCRWVNRRGSDLCRRCGRQREGTAP